MGRDVGLGGMELGLDFFAMSGLIGGFFFGGIDYVD